MWLFGKQVSTLRVARWFPGEDAQVMLTVPETHLVNLAFDPHLL